MLVSLQTDGNRLFKDVKAYYAAVRGESVHNTVPMHTAALSASERKENSGSEFLVLLSSLVKVKVLQMETASVHVCQKAQFPARKHGCPDSVVTAL